jgi:cysteine desulfurase
MRVYLDHNASAPLRPSARAAITAALAWCGNPSSAHRDGARMRRAIAAARGEVAAAIGARPADVTFTSGATEANNLALRGLLAPGDLLVTSSVEHASILAPAAALEERGVRVQRLGVDHAGQLDPDEVATMLAARPRLVSLAIANGETGAITDVGAIAEQAHAVGALVHCDAAQAFGRLPCDVTQLGVDALSLSAHKIGGPAGSGALWLREGIDLRTQLEGGGQERGRRAGTENVLGIVGFGAAAAAVRVEAATAPARMRRLRDRLWTLLTAAIPGLQRNGSAWSATLPNTLNVSVAGVPGESLLVLLDLGGVAASLGSACAAGSVEPSHVLLAMGRDPERARAGLRLSLGPDTTEADVERAAAALVAAVAQIERGRAA